MIKVTVNLNQWYEYTYWCSPVKDQIIENAFPDTPSDRRFWFNAKNYFPEELTSSYDIKKLGEIIDVKSSKRVLQSEWKNKGIPFYRGREKKRKEGGRRKRRGEGGDKRRITYEVEDKRAG